MTTDIQSLFNQLPSLENKFINSLHTQFIDTKSLSDKQVACLKTNVERYEQAKSLLQYCNQERCNLYSSFKKQFDTKHFLSDKQMNLLKEMQLN